MIPEVHMRVSWEMLYVIDMSVFFFPVLGFGFRGLDVVASGFQISIGRPQRMCLKRQGSS